MAIAAPLQSHFDGGEISPLVQGRVDSDRYKSSLDKCLNWIPALQGGLRRRSGTAYVGAVKNASSYTRLIPFEFSTTQAYVLEFGNTYIRFYENYGQLQLSGAPFEVATIYQTADLSSLRFTQSADVLYIAHPKYPTMKLQRLGATSWNLVPVIFQDGPYLPINSTNMTMTASGTSGLVTVTLGPIQNPTNYTNSGTGLILVTMAAHGWVTGQMVYIDSVTGTTEANGTWTITVVDADTFTLNGSTFVHTYISGGNLHPTHPLMLPSTSGGIFGVNNIVVRMEVGGNWVWGTAGVLGFPNPYTFPWTIDPSNTLSGTTATLSWALGLYYTGGTGISFNNFPGNCTFHEDRLSFSGCPSNPQRIDCSMSSDYEHFAPSGFDGTVAANNALDFSLNANDVNLIEWMASTYKGLLAGSVSNEWAIRPSDLTEALTPTNISAKRNSKWGSFPLQNIQVGLATIHVQRGARKIRELLYSFYIDGFVSTDLTELAEHITGSGITDIAYQSIPISVVWMVRNDGALVAMTYDRDQTQLRTGFHQHILGGHSDAGGTPPIIESIAVIPSPDGTRDDLWMTVRRYVNGQTVRYIEYMTPIFEDIVPQNNAFFADCGNTYDAPITITGVTKANPAVVTAPAHGLATGNQVRIDGVVGMVSGGVSVLNTLWFKVTVIDSSTFSLQDTSGNNIDTTGATTYVSGGFVRKLVTTISGLTYLEGETVSVLADGAELAPQVVSNSGVVTLPLQAAIVTIGYPYNSDAKLLRLEAGSRNGTAQGKIRRTHRVGILVHESQGLQVGSSFSALDPVQFRKQGVDLNTRCPALFSGMETHTLDFDYDFDNQICLRAAGLLPCMILGIYPMLETQDRA